MQIIGTILNIFFIFILLLMMGLGFLFGMWRRLRSLGGLLIGVLLLIILINPIANGLVNMNLPFVGESITDLVVELVSNEMANGAVITKNSELALLCNSVALSIAKIAVLFIGMLIVFAVIVPLNLIILRIVLGPDKHEKNIGIRFAGMGIAALEVLIGFFLVTLPIFGTTSLIMSYEDVLSPSDNTSEVVEVIDAVEAIDDAIPNKITKIFGKKAPVNALGAITKAKNKNGTINIYKEISNAKPIIKIALEAESKYEGDFLSAAIDNREELINFIRETNILETFMPAVLEILEASDSLEGVDIEELKKIDFSTDKAYIADMLSVLFDFIEETELDFENPEALLGNENLPTALKGFGEALKDTTFLDLLLGVLQNALDDALVSAEGLESLTEILDVTKIERENLSSDLYQLGVIANAIYNSGILEEADLLSKPEELKKLINAVLDFSLVKGNEAEIIDTLLETANLKEALVELGVEINYENIDWNIEKVKLGNIIDAIADANKNIENFNFENVGEYLSNDNERKYMINILNSLMDSSLIGNKFIVNIVTNLVNESDLGIDISKLDFNKVSSWENEITAIFELIDIVNSGELDITKLSEEELEKIVLTATGTKEEPTYITSFLLGTIINEELEAFLGQEEYANFIANHDLTNPDTLRNSVHDIVIIITLASKAEDIPSAEDWTEEEIKDFCDTVGSLDLKDGEVATTVIHSIVKETGADVSLEEIVNADMEKEAECLEEILTAIQSGTSEKEIEKLIEEAKNNTTIVAAIIDKFYEE